MHVYMTMRILFSKASLTAKDVDALLTEAELLVNYAAYRLARPSRRFTGAYLVMKLSSLFMVFDYLVCTIEVVGDKMNTGRWWPAFVQKFPTAYFVTERRGRKKTKLLNRLVNRLCLALSVYKEGRRPEFREIIDLKRAILAQAYKDSQLANPLWELWRRDDKQFSSGGCDEQSPAEDQEHGQRESDTP
ncbi:uncharacterized protein EMH_0094650 [Eimeria mitis]|uniref:Uncharacterized protein n=1 Tax=Eimeria mitis TaxID=44415 RepID=U6KFB8_9EIME|nr:uncharacterized protein EMH_0094650 [Eimeria mitis]CDJ36730.1 hypothetical protein EMH_0094650 [Eimeria mitis]